MRRFLLTTAVAATALVGSACGDTTGIGTNVVGSYELIRANGQTLPAEDVTGDITFYAGVLDINSDGSFEDIIQYRVVGDPLIRESPAFGSWDYSGNDIELVYDNGYRTFADRPSNSRLIVEDEEGNIFEYRRF